MGLVLVITLVAHPRVLVLAIIAQVRAVPVRAIIVPDQVVLVAVCAQVITTQVRRVQGQAIVQVLGHRVQAHIAAVLPQAVHLPVLRVAVDAVEVAVVEVDSTNIKQI